MHNNTVPYIESFLLCIYGTVCECMYNWTKWGQKKPKPLSIISLSNVECFHQTTWICSQIYWRAVTGFSLNICWMENREFSEALRYEKLSNAVYLTAYKTTVSCNILQYNLQYDVCDVSVRAKDWRCVRVCVVGEGGGSGGHLVGHGFVFESRFIQQQLQLPAVEVGDSQRLNKSCVFASL